MISAKELAGQVAASQLRARESSPRDAAKRIFNLHNIPWNDPRYREVMKILGRRGGLVTASRKKPIEKKAKTKPFPQWYEH